MAVMDAIPRQDGCVIDYTPDADVAAYEVVEINGLLGVAPQPIASGKLGSIQITGVAECGKIASVAFSVDERAYWDNDGTPSGGTGTGCVTKVAAGNRLLGQVVYAAAASDTTVWVKLAQSLHEHFESYKVEDLAADADIAARPIFAHPRPGRVAGAFILAQDSAAGISGSDTAVIALKDAAGNTIVTKTYNASTAFPASGVQESLGTPDATHSVLTAGESVNLSVTNSTNANLPLFIVSLLFLPDNQ